MVGDEQDVCIKSSFLLWFLFPRDMKLDSGRQCHSAGVCLKEIIGLEGVELGADGKVGMF